MVPPVAGQGLNSGVRDATNLAWKNDEVRRGRADRRRALLRDVTVRALPRTGPGRRRLSEMRFRLIARHRAGLVVGDHARPWPTPVGGWRPRWVLPSSGSSSSNLTAASRR
ncbi:FAD-dependent monooxygenase [Streptomyces sp. NPDC087440]|uniref:FAD-dependent monooxygenase n=1 Tax=Streptomyces sp. NPDC087440 TaxID=3365790 RepID=UPI003813BC83